MQSTKALRLAMCALGLVALGACSKPLTRQLFFTSTRPHAYLPTSGEEAAGRAGTLSEIVTYRQRIDTIRKAKSSDTTALKADKMKTLSLDQLTVTAERPKVRISTLREGKVNLSFLVSVPRAFMNESYQVVLSPRLMAGDTTLSLPPVVLRGKAFKVAQERSQKRLERFQKSIVDSADYDSAFFDRRAHSHFMRLLQNDYYYAYKRMLSLQQGYERWLRIIQERYFHFNAEAKGAYDTDYHAKALDMLRSAYRDDLAGRDSVGQREGFRMIYTPEREARILGKRERRIDSTNIPGRYLQIHTRGWTMDSLVNKSLTEKDSLEVATHTYLWKKLAHNESRRNHRKDYRRHLDHFPTIEGALLDQDIDTSRDFIYLYSYDVKVIPQMKKRLQVAVGTRVTAADRSTWMQSGVDTLAFVISGINDLVDATLIDRWSDKPESAIEYKEALERMSARDYRAALEIFRKYPDYNAAVAFAGLEDDERALMVLRQLRPTGKVAYLTAYCLMRQGKEAEARSSLLSAVRQENFLLYKAESEPVFAKLMEDAAYHSELKQQTDILDE